MNIKENDFFTAWYTDEYREANKNSDLRHCFEGLLRAEKNHRGEMILVDCFWNVYSRDQYARAFKLEQIGTIINIKFLANLNDLEKIIKSDQKYYDDSDLVELHRQHSCANNCVVYYIRKGAKKSVAKLTEYVTRKRESLERKIEMDLREIEYLKELVIDESTIDDLRIWC